MKSFHILMLTGILVLSSCDNMLEEHPKGVTEETFYRNTDDMDAALAAPIQSMHKDGGWKNYAWAMPELLSDMTHGMGSWAQPGEYTALNGTNQERTDKLWEDLYNGIMQCNVPLSHLSQSQISEADKAKYRGQFRFLRGYFYFCIMRGWGKGVLRTEANMNAYSQPMSNAATLWDYITSDLVFASQNAPEDAKPGLPTKWAALAVLSDVYLWQKKYAQAEDCARQVMNSGKFSLVAVSHAENFDNVFGPELGINSEEIFYAKFDNRIQGMSSEIAQMCAVNNVIVRGHSMNGPGGMHAFYVRGTEPLISQWSDDDLRKQYDLVEHDFQLNVGKTYAIAKFCDPSSQGGGNDLPLVRYADVLLNFAESDAMATGRPTAESLEAVNQIHRRAYGHDPQAASTNDYRLADYSTLAQFMSLVDTEQAYETFGEGKRWYYMKRRGIVKKQIRNAFGIEASDYCLQWRIPESEYGYNQLITAADQNPGY